MTDPSIFDITSAWNYLWYISMAIMIIAWVIIIAATLTAAAAVPYLAARAMAKPGQRRRPTTSGRTLIIAAVAVIILMAGTVTGLAYGVGAAKDHDLFGRLDPHSGAADQSTPTHENRHNRQVLRKNTRPATCRK